MSVNAALYIFSCNQQTKIDFLFLFGYYDVRAFQVFKWTAGCISKCKTMKTKLAKNVKDSF